MRGAVSALTDDLVCGLQNEFDRHGVAAIERARLQSPLTYLKIIAAILPKQVEITEGPFDGVSDSELAALVRAALVAQAARDK